MKKERGVMSFTFYLTFLNELIQSSTTLLIVFDEHFHVIAKVRLVLQVQTVYFAFYVLQNYFVVESRIFSLFIFVKLAELDRVHEIKQTLLAQLILTTGRLFNHVFTRFAHLFHAFQRVLVACE